MIFPPLFFLMLAKVVADAPRMAADPSTTARIVFEWSETRTSYGVVWTEHEMPWPVAGLERDQYEAMLFEEANRAMRVQQERYP